MNEAETKRARILVKLAKVEAKLNKQELAEAQAEKELLDAQEECAAEIDSQLGGAGGYLAGAAIGMACGIAAGMYPAAAAKIANNVAVAVLPDDNL